MEANKMDPDQTAEKQSDQGPYYLQYRLPKKKSRQEEQMTKIVTDGKRVNRFIKGLLLTMSMNG